MLNAFIIVLREGFESFLIVAVILSYLRKSGQQWLNSAVYMGIVFALFGSAGLGYLLRYGVDDAVLERLFGQSAGFYASQFLGNEALREGVLGLIAVVMVGSLVVHMWRTGPKLRTKMHERLRTMSSRRSKATSLIAVFLFTFLLVTREGMETALLLFQVRSANVINGAVLGFLAAGAFAWGWARYGHLLNIKHFFQVTSVFLLLFMLQVATYSFHEFSEAGLLPNSDALHAATEKFSPDGLYGKWFSPLMVGFCALWLASAGMLDRARLRPPDRTKVVEQSGH